MERRPAWRSSPISAGKVNASPRRLFSMTLRSLSRRGCLRRLGSLPMLLAWSCCAHVAHATERPGDIAMAAALRKYSIAALAVQRDYLSLSKVASGEERFNLYWTHNQSVG